MRAPAPGIAWINARDRIAALALVVIAAIDSGLFAYYVKTTLILQPYWDMFAIVMRYLQYREDGEWWSYVWAPHLQHHPVWVRLLSAFDAETFGGVGYPFVVSAVACHIVTAWLLWRERLPDSPSALRWMIGCLVVMLVMTSVSAVDCAIPMNGIYPQTLMFAVLTFVLFVGDPEARANRSRALWRRVIALMAAIAAAFGSAPALVIWPLLVWAAWRERFGSGWTIAVLFVGGAFTAVYLIGLPLTSGVDAMELRRSDTNALDRLLRMASYLTGYVGLPWTRAEALATPGRLLGAVLLVAGVWVSCRRALVRPAGGRLELLAVLLILFSLSTAVLATIGRIDVESDVRVPVRYAPFLTPLHVGLLWLAWPFARRCWTTRSSRRLVQAAMMAGGLLLLVQQVAAGEAAAVRTRSMKQTIARFLAGEETADMTDVIFVDLARARHASTAIRRAGLYLEVQ